MPDDTPFEGGCHCGAIRYHASGEPIETVYCHCRDCQRTTGAPVLAWTAFAREHFEYTRGTPNIYRSSAEAQREFCGQCGAQILFRQDLPTDSIDVNVGSLDQPDATTPNHHTWTASRISWFETADDLPRFEEEAPEPVDV
jgi:hypothetical protein